MGNDFAALEKSFHEELVAAKRDQKRIIEAGLLAQHHLEMHWPNPIQP
jgi:hypothetical protein